MKNESYRVIGGIKLFKESLVKNLLAVCPGGRTLLQQKTGGLLRFVVGASEKCHFDDDHHGIDFDGTEKRPWIPLKHVPLNVKGGG